MRSRVCLLRCCLALVGPIASEAIAQVPGPIVRRADATIAPEDLLREAFVAFRDRLSLSAPIGSPGYGTGQLKIIQRYASHSGPVSIEVHQSDSATTVWIASPRQLNAGTPRVYVWYGFRREAGPRFVPLKNPLMESTPYVGPIRGTLDADYLMRTGRWSHGEEFGSVESVNVDDDPPHWSPVLSSLEFTREDYVRLHELMQNNSTLDSARLLLDAAAPGRADLSERAKLEWIPVTLRGFINSAHVSSTDMIREHSTDFVTDGDAPSGWLTDGASGDPNWAGQDVNIHVLPDPDVRYLASVSKADQRFDIETEIEQFSLRLRRRYTPEEVIEAYRRGGSDPMLLVELPNKLKPPEPSPYWHQRGEWIQMTGRWIIDPGHTVEWENMSSALRAVFRHHGLDVRPTMKEFNTEIHPWELSVASTTVGAVTQAKVIVTGAWNGEDLTFAVYPPLRPSATARLRYRIHRADAADGFDELIGARLDAVPWPAANPNHVVFRLVSLDPAPVVRYSTGRVGMVRERSVHAIVDAWWEGGVSDTPISGRVVATDGPISNTRLLFRRTFALTRDDGAAALHWTDVPMRAGSFSLHSLEAASYTLRPSSPDWDFAGRTIELREGRPESIALTALRRRDLGSSASIWREPALPSFGLEPAAAYLLYGQLVTSPEISSRLGSELAVTGSGLTYEKAGYAILHISGLARSSADATAIRSATDAVESTARYRAPGIRPWILLGYPTAGVAGVRIRANLLIRVRDTTWVADDKEFATDDEGYAIIPFRSGSHAEDVAIAWQVALNPFNPWFVPGGLTPWARIVPGDETDVSPASLPAFEGGRGPGLSRPAITAAPPIPVFSLRDSIAIQSVSSLRDQASEKNQMSRMIAVIRTQKGGFSELPAVRGLGSTARVAQPLPNAIAAAWSAALAGRAKTGLTKQADQSPGRSKVPEKKEAAGISEKGTPAGKAGAAEKGPGIMEGELLAKGSSASAGKVAVADMSKSSVAWSGGAQLLWVGGGAGDRLTLHPLVSVPGRYSMAGYFALGAQYCDFNVAVNGAAIGSVRTSSDARETRSDKIVVGDVELRRGENEVTIELRKGVSPEGQSRNCSVGVDGFEFRPMK